VIADSLLLAWMMAYEVLSAPPAMGNPPKVIMDSDEAHWIAKVAPEGKVGRSNGKGWG
jgi:hypothetical protein